MKKAFSIFEILLVIVIISILVSFFMPKYKNTINETTKVKIKSDIALIRNAILKKKTQNTLLNDDSIFKLDSAQIEALNSRLFENILDFPLLSTNSTIKEKGKWIKKSENSYITYISSNEKLEYKYEDFSFSCTSNLTLCEKFE